MPPGDDSNVQKLHRDGVFIGSWLEVMVGTVILHHEVGVHNE